MSIWSVDCDLRRIHVWSSSGGAVFSKESDLNLVAATFQLGGADTILYEIASPVAYIEGRGAMHNMNKWLLYNAAVAMRLECVCRGQLLVSPSHVWTRGYELKTRHKLAGATAKTKDLRECQTMQYMYKARPQDWVPLPQFLDQL